MRIIAFILFFLMTTVSESQTWFKTGEVWINEMSGFDIEGIEIFEVVGDTLINGKTYTNFKYRIRRIEYRFGKDTVDFTVRMAMREEAGRVYDRHFNASRDILIYDFNLNVGDTLIIKPPYCKEDTLIVAEKNRINIGPEVRTEQILHRVGYDISELQVIEGIGFTGFRRRDSPSNTKFVHGYLRYSEIVDCIWSDPQPYLRCYSDGVINYNPKSLVCDSIYGREETKTQTVAHNVIDVYPNPFDDLITISTERDSDVLVYEILDIYGAVQKTGSLNPGFNKNIRLEELNQGSYILKVEVDGVISVRRIVK